MLNSVLFVLVTCSRDESRNNALQQTVQALIQEHKESQLCDNLIVFDNNSLFKAPLKELPPKVRIINASSNIGYWGALQWTLNNVEYLTGRTYKYIHPIESDLVLYNTQQIQSAIGFLDANPEYHSVRTQEFHIKTRWRYFKESPRLIRKKRSCVTRLNFITQKKATFSKITAHDNIYTATWHTKVPALHRFSVLKSAFNHLAKMKNFKEGDFMSYMHSASPYGIGVLDGGIYYDQLGTPTDEGVTGSYSSQEELKQHQYLGTRIATISGETPSVFISSPSDIPSV